MAESDFPLSTPSSFIPNDVLLDIEKLETTLTNSSRSSTSDSSSSIKYHRPLCSPPHSTSMIDEATTMRYTGSSKIYLRHLNKFLADIEQKQAIIAAGSGSILKRLRSANASSSRPLTFTSLFSRPVVKCSSNNRLEPKTISFAQIVTQYLPPSNHQLTPSSARLNEKMWVVHCREQLIKAVNDELQQAATRSANSVKAEEIDLDWQHISSYHLNDKWSSNVCQNAWKQLCNPHVNQSKWTSKEERRLLALVDSQPLCANRWLSIAQELGTDRSAYLCAKRYMQITNEQYSKRPLEADERQRIISTIQDDNQGHYTQYNKLAYELGNRTREFIYTQWLHIDPSCKRGRWSEDEHTELLTRLDRQTRTITNWPLISAPVRTRSSRQCRERALDTLKNGHRTSKEKPRPFTVTEDLLLLEQYSQHGSRWATIAKQFSSRTDNSLLVRYRMLIKAQKQWQWFCTTNKTLKQFLFFLYNKQNSQDQRSIEMFTSNNYLSPTNNNNFETNNTELNEIRLDIEQFGFFRRGLPFPMTDEEFEWFNEKPELIDNIARVTLNEFSQQYLCARKFKVEIKPWFTSPSTMAISDETIRQMLHRIIPNRQKRKSLNTSAGSSNKKSKFDGVFSIDDDDDGTTIDTLPTTSLDCKEEPILPRLPSILSTSRHILRPMANQFFTSQTNTKMSMTNSSTHFCPFLLLIR